MNKIAEYIIDDVRSVEMWDFSGANRDDNTRAEAVSKVASVCYQSEGVDPKKLYDKLYRESLGLPSSSFEFVPVLLTFDEIRKFDDIFIQNSHKSEFRKFPDTMVYGEIVSYGTNNYHVTNLRALLSDIELANKAGASISLDEFNTADFEQSILASSSFVFKIKMDIVSARQLMRHRQSWQEMSRRYVSGNKVPFSFYVPKELEGYKYKDHDFKDILDLCVGLYGEMVNNGVKAQDARRIMPQAAMTEVWFGSTITPLVKMLELRTAKKTQESTRQIAEAINVMLHDYINSAK